MITILAMSRDSVPKVILKMGSYHSGRKRISLNYCDIGNQVQQWADSPGTKSLHIRFLNRYIDGEDMMENDNYSASRNLMTVGKTDPRAIVDGYRLGNFISRRHTYWVMRRIAWLLTYFFKKSIYNLISAFI